MDKYILAINPGSTSTKFAIYKDSSLLFQEKISHDAAVLKNFSSIIDQTDFRKNLIFEKIKEKGFALELLSAVSGRGGLLKPLASGTYLVNDAMLSDLKSGKYGVHASNLGAIIAHEIASQLNIPAFIVDPVSVDEFIELARISGMPMIERTAIFHALNHKAIARHVSNDVGKKYEELNLLICHMGGGISVGAHMKGKVIDATSALDGDGPMTPERSGSVPIGPLTKLCFSGKYTYEEIRNLNYGRGGLIAYLNTNDVREVIKRINAGDTYAKKILDAMIYQIAKEIGAYATVLFGEVDYIVLTGGIAYEKYVTDELIKRIGFIAKVLIYPGEDELHALALGALRVLNNLEEVKTY